MASNPKIISVVDRHGNHRKEKVIHQEDFKAKLSRFAAQYFVDEHDFAVDHFDALADGGTYTLGPLQQQEQQQRQSIFSHGLPEMGPLSESTCFTSNPSVPTDEQHAPATMKIAPFAVLSDLKEPGFPADNIWNRITEKGHLGGFASENGVNKFVERVLMDVIDAIGVKGAITIREEVEVMRNRPDFMVILVKGHPVGTIEGKQPGDVAMTHPNILGEVYDQLQHLHSIFRVDIPFAILTSYDQWRICWLDNPESNSRAALAQTPVPSTYATPVKRKQESVNAPEVTTLMKTKPESPLLPETPSRKKGLGRLQSPDIHSAVDVENLGVDDHSRQFCGTEVLEWKDTRLPAVLSSVIKKMMLARQEGSPKVLRLVNRKTFAWKRAPPFQTLNFDLCISKAVRNFFLWEDLGSGADGKAFLVSGGTKGAVGVLKFFFKDAAQRAEHELRTWKAVYSHLPPVNETIRIVQVMQQTTLLMPWFQCPERTWETLQAVQTTLREDFQEKGFRHDDVAWRNVGVYRGEGGQVKAVVFDMQRVVEFHQKEDWVHSAVLSLSEKLV